jgi:PKD repeat protein
VVTTPPMTGAAHQPWATAPTATFSEAIQASSIAYTFTAGATAVPSKVSYNSTTFTATITPNAPLALATKYTLTIKAKDLAGNQMTGAAPTWSFSTDTPPAAQLAATPAGGDVPLAVAFDATRSTDADSTPIASYDFGWGDGTAGSGAQASGGASHTYTKAGTYTATVTVTDTAGYSSTATTSVVATNPDYPPASSLAATPAAPTTADAVTLDASASTDTDDTPVASYAFDFGDGSAGTGPQSGATATHTYAAAGSYTATVTVTDTAGKSSTATTTVAVTAPAAPDNAPSAALAASPDGALAPADIVLDASRSSDADATPIATYAFDFGDGTAPVNQTSATAAHTYAKAGTYTATVTVTDTAGKTGTATTTVTVAKDDPPAAALAATPTSGMVPLKVAFDAGASTDADATAIATYTFDYGDGTAPVEQASATASHTYTSDGSYTAKVTVTDSAGNASSATSGITVTPDSPPAAVLSGPGTATTNAEVTFSGSGSTDTDGTPIASYAFTWGDGTPGSGELVDSTASHTYAKAGTYAVVLTVKDTGGQISTASANVTVSDPPPVVVDNPPTAALTVATTPQSLAVTADATASTDGDSTPIDTYGFDFGDGTVLQAQPAGTAQHTYPKAGTYTVTVTVTDTAGKASTATAAATVTAPPPPPPPPALKNTTVVLTFDDGTTGQDQAASVLKQYGMHGTFYINSGRLGFPGYLTGAQVQAIAADGNEIGGHTVNHSDLTTLSADDAAREICNDRVALANLGVRPTSFAYPFGALTSTTQAQVKSCGYNSARKIADLKSVPYGCANCPTANPIPPIDPYAIKTNSSVKYDTTLAILQTYVTQAENDQGGLVPIVFHHVGSTGDTNEISLATFTQFVQWLSQRPSTTLVKTMDQVVGGSYVTPVPGPALPTQNPNLVQNYSLEQATSNVPTGFQLGSSGTNTATWAWSTDAHSGSRSERVDITSYTSGDRKLVMKQDSSTVPPQVTAGHKYAASVWAKGSGSGAIVTYYRDSTGVWKFWQQAPTVTYGSTWTQFTFTTPAVPAGATAVSFGLSLTGLGNLTTDDYSLLDNG